MSARWPGIPVVLNDIAPDRIKEALATINGNMARQVSRKRITEDDKQAALKRIIDRRELSTVSPIAIW